MGLLCHTDTTKRGVKLAPRCAISLLYAAKQTEEVGIDVVGDLEEVGGILLEVASVAVDDYEVALVVLDPVLVSTIEAGEIVERHGLLIVASALMDVVDEVGQGTADVDHQVGEACEGNHGVEEVAVIVEVAVGHHTHVVEVGCEDTRILEDGAVLDNGFLGLRNLDHFLETLGEEVDLDIE